MENNKEILYVVPHTHWDREWYFTKATGDVLLNHMLNDIFYYGLKSPMMLDGQFSLLDDYLEANPDRKSKFSKLLKEGYLSCGPFYTQPDLFNSSGETTLRNIEMGQNIARQLGAPVLKTAYLPDTFGFNSNLPQILKTKGIKNFVFWRGPSEELVLQSAYFIWEGIDGSKVKAYNFRNGYYQLGQYYPYNEVEKLVYKKNAKTFCEKLDLAANSLILNQSNARLLPLGGDQAPYLHKASEIIKNDCQKTSQYDLKITSNYDDFFQNNLPPQIHHTGILRTPFTGKIHRTISSTRYDLKKAFREAETKLYHLLEPLESVYALYDQKYDFTSFKNKHIIKPLLLAQAHDSLGGCNTDITNKRALERLDKINDFIISQVDLLIKKLLNHQQIIDETIAIFNPSPFKSQLFERKTIYSETKKVNINTNNFKIFTIATKNISLVENKPLYEQDVIIFKDNCRPLALTTINLKDNFEDLEPIPQILKTTSAIKIIDDRLIFQINGENFKIAFKAIADAGDSYDFSPGEVIKLTQNHKLVKSLLLDEDIEFIELTSQLKINDLTSNVKWDLFFNKKAQTVKTKFKINNHFVNVRLSLLVEKSYQKLVKSQHLAMTNFVEDDFISNWKEKYKEYLLHVDHNDGLIRLDDLNIMTLGTNEFYKLESGIELVLYRTNEYVTRSNMAYRPSTSGLSFEWKSTDALLQKELNFDLCFSKNKKPVKMLNNYKFRPYIYKLQFRNFIAHKMSKFVLNDIIAPQSKKLDLKISDPEIFISSMRKKNRDIHLRFVNMKLAPKAITVTINGNQHHLQFKKYEIKTLKLKGIY